MMRVWTATCLGLLVALTIWGQPGANQPGGPPPAGGGFVASGDLQKIYLWENGAPGATGNTEADKPSLMVYRPGLRSGNAGVIVIPGGAYRGPAIPNEGVAPCTRLNLNGVTAFLLRPRIAPYRHPVELGDARRAIRMFRSRAAEFGIDPGKIGVMGFSAGGHLASTAGTHFDTGDGNAVDPIDRASSRPDPANTTARVYLPSIGSGRVVTKGGKPIQSQR
jgi:hypothetical protein